MDQGCLPNYPPWTVYSPTAAATTGVKTSLSIHFLIKTYSRKKKRGSSRQATNNLLYCSHIPWLIKIKFPFLAEVHLENKNKPQIADTNRL